MEEITHLYLFECGLFMYVHLWFKDVVKCKLHPWVHDCIVESRVMREIQEHYAYSSPFHVVSLYPCEKQPWEAPGIFLPHSYFSALSQCPCLGPCYSMGLQLHVSRIPQGFTAYPYSRAGVAIPRGMPICRGPGRSGVNQSNCVRVVHYSLELYIHVSLSFQGPLRHLTGLIK